MDFGRVPPNRKQRKRAERLAAKQKQNANPSEPKPFATLKLTPELQKLFPSGRVDFAKMTPEQRGAIESALVQSVTPEQSQRAKEIHESGHAVAALVLGLGVNHIEIREDAQPHAQVGVDLERPFEGMVVAYAGEAAERIVNSQRWCSSSSHTGGDKQLADRLAALLPAGVDHHTSAREAAETLVGKYAPLVRKFAASLAEKKYLGAADIHALLQGEGGKAYLAPSGGD